MISPKYHIHDTEELKQLVTDICKSEFSYCICNIYFAHSEDEFESIYDIPIWKIDNMGKLNIIIEE